MFTVLVTGSRDWHDVDALEHALLRALVDHGAVGPSLLVSGACPTGADFLAEQMWESRGWPIERHPADWSQHGRRAGFLRNTEMVQRGADVCVAFQRNQSKGTQQTIDLATKAGLPVRVVQENTFIFTTESGSVYEIDLDRPRIRRVVNTQGLEPTRRQGEDGPWRTYGALSLTTSFGDSQLSLFIDWDGQGRGTLTSPIKDGLDRLQELVERPDDLTLFVL